MILLEVYGHAYVSNPISTQEFYKLIQIDDCLDNLRNNGKSFLVFTNNFEGYSQAKYNIFNHLTDLGIEYKIPSGKIIYLTSNLLEEEMYKEWCEENNTDYRIKVFSFNTFEFIRYTSLEPFPGTIDDTVNQIKSLPKENLKNFLCLNRVHRTFRTSVCCMLHNSNLKEELKISYDRFECAEVIYSFKDCFDIDIENDYIQSFVESSPSILDRTDFDVNWAKESMPLDLFFSTLVNITTETIEPIKLSSSWYKKMIFYSEKTFKVMEVNQPLFIFGFPGMNTNLSKIGYKTYDAYFDLSFDNIDNHYERATRQIKILEDLNEKLKSMSHDQKIKWLLSDVETLHHNKIAKHKSEFTKNTVERVVEYFYSYNC